VHHLDMATSGVTTSAQIDALLRKHKAHSTYPFRRWQQDEATFWDLRAFYEEFFRISVGDMTIGFLDVLPPRYDPTAMPFDMVQRPEPARRVSLTPIVQGGMMLVTVRAADDGYKVGQNGFAGLPDRSWMSLGVDFTPRRLVAIANVIRIYVGMPFTDLDGETQMCRQFVDNLGPVFERPGRRRADLSLQGDVPTYAYTPRRRVPL
jgi:hypothetical protein